jgi:hypothetical protein
MTVMMRIMLRAGNASVSLKDLMMVGEMLSFPTI